MVLVVSDTELQQPFAIVFSCLVKVTHIWRIAALDVLVWLFLFDTFLFWDFCVAGNRGDGGKKVRSLLYQTP